tara:strand:- start:1906 stop:2049 length:144 start_codon:yes stop_codon:yes gene_type:complete
METAITAITTAADFSPLVTGLGALGAALAVPYITYRGVSMLLSAIRR